MIMQLAGQEAIASEFDSIRPEHVLAAIFKFSELPVDEIVKVAPGSGAAKQLPVEVSELRKEFTARGIDSTLVRRQLRAALGKAGRPFDGGAIHRSDEARAIFDSGARIADDNGEETLTAVHLFEAVLKAPTKAIVELLSDSQRVPVKRVSNTPLLDQVGMDLTSNVRAGHFADVEDRQIEAKALLEALARSDGKSVLLVCDAPVVGKTAKAVAVAAARAITQRTAPKQLLYARIVDLGTSAFHSVEIGQGNFKQIVEEAAGAKNVVLLVEPVSKQSWKDPQSYRIQTIVDVACRRPLRFILPVSVSDYAAIFKSDGWWKKNAQPIWVGRGREKGVPTEL